MSSAISLDSITQHLVPLVAYCEKIVGGLHTGEDSTGGSVTSILAMIHHSETPPMWVTPNMLINVASRNLSAKFFIWKLWAMQRFFQCRPARSIISVVSLNSSVVSLKLSPVNFCHVQQSLLNHLSLRCLWPGRWRLYVVLTEAPDYETKLVHDGNVGRGIKLDGKYPVLLQPCYNTLLNGVYKHCQYVLHGRVLSQEIILPLPTTPAFDLFFCSTAANHRMCSLRMEWLLIINRTTAKMLPRRAWGLKMAPARSFRCPRHGKPWTISLLNALMMEFRTILFRSTTGCMLRWTNCRVERPVFSIKYVSSAALCSGDRKVVRFTLIVQLTTIHKVTGMVRVKIDTCGTEEQMPILVETQSWPSACFLYSAIAVISPSHCRGYVLWLNWMYGSYVLNLQSPFRAFTNIL